MISAMIHEMRVSFPTLILAFPSFKPSDYLLKGSDIFILENEDCKTYPILSDLRRKASPNEGSKVCTQTGQTHETIKNVLH